MVKVTHVAKKMLIFVLMALKQLDGASVFTRWLNVGNPPINAVLLRNDVKSNSPCSSFSLCNTCSCSCNVSSQYQ